MKAHNGGFSLIEVLVVIGAIGILVGIAIPAYNSYREKAQIAEAQQVLKDIERAFITLAIDTGEWPGPIPIGTRANAELDHLNYSKAGLTNNDNNDFLNWNGPYIEGVVPLDPWGSNYFFDPDYDAGGPDKVPAIGSHGPNKSAINVYDSDNVILLLPCKKADCT